MKQTTILRRLAEAKAFLVLLVLLTSTPLLTVATTAAAATTAAVAMPAEDAARAALDRQDYSVFFDELRLKTPDVVVKGLNLLFAKSQFDLGDALKRRLIATLKSLCDDRFAPNTQKALGQLVVSQEWQAYVLEANSKLIDLFEVAAQEQKKTSQSKESQELVVSENIDGAQSEDEHWNIARINQCRNELCAKVKALIPTIIDEHPYIIAEEVAKLMPKNKRYWLPMMRPVGVYHANLPLLNSLDLLPPFKRYMVYWALDYYCNPAVVKHFGSFPSHAYEEHVQDIRDRKIATRLSQAKFVDKESPKPTVERHPFDRSDIHVELPSDQLSNQQTIVQRVVPYILESYSILPADKIDALGAYFIPELALIVGGYAAQGRSSFGLSVAEADKHWPLVTEYTEPINPQAPVSCEILARHRLIDDVEDIGVVVARACDAQKYKKSGKKVVVNIVTLREQIIDKLPANFGNMLPDVEELDLSDNVLSTITPGSLRSMVNLKRLILNKNPLEAWPEEIEHIPNLEYLSVSDTPLGESYDDSQRLEKFRTVLEQRNKAKQDLKQTK
jgi:hypothetical protein